MVPLCDSRLSLGLANFPNAGPRRISTGTIVPLSGLRRGLTHSGWGPTLEIGMNVPIASSPPPAAPSGDHDAGRALAAEVRGRRRALGLSQRDLAELAGVSERFVRFVEQAKPSIQLDTLLAVLDALGLELAVRRREAP